MRSQEQAERIELMFRHLTGAERQPDMPDDLALNHISDDLHDAGDPTPRERFILVQHALAQQPSSMDSNHPDRRPLLEEQWKLWKEHGEEWTKQEASSLMKYFAGRQNHRTYIYTELGAGGQLAKPPSYRRGFINEVALIFEDQFNADVQILLANNPTINTLLIGPNSFVEQASVQGGTFEGMTGKPNLQINSLNIDYFNAPSALGISKLYPNLQVCTLHCRTYDEIQQLNEYLPNVYLHISQPTWLTPEMQTAINCHNEAVPECNKEQALRQKREDKEWDMYQKGGKFPEEPKKKESVPAEKPNENLVATSVKQGLLQRIKSYFSGNNKQ